jgi:hypothetical protein
MEYEKAGILSLVNISDTESKLFLSYIRSANKTTAVDFVEYMLGMDYLQFLDLLAGTNLKIPNRKNLYRDLEYIKIYNYCKVRNFTVESMVNAAKLYEIGLVNVKKALIKVSKTIGEKMPYTEEELNDMKPKVVVKDVGDVIEIAEIEKFDEEDFNG